MSKSDSDKSKTKDSPKKSKYEDYFISSNKSLSDYQLFKQFRLRESEFSKLRNSDSPFRYLSAEISEVMFTNTIIFKYN